MQRDDFFDSDGEDSGAENAVDNRDDFFDDDDEVAALDEEVDDFGVQLDDDQDDDDDVVLQSKTTRLKKASKSKSKGKKTDTVFDDEDDMVQDEKTSTKKKSEKSAPAKKKAQTVKWGETPKSVYSPSDPTKKVMNIRQHCAITRTEGTRIETFTIKPGEFFLLDVKIPGKGKSETQIMRMYQCAHDVDAHHTAIQAQQAVTNPDDEDSNEIFLTNHWVKFHRGLENIVRKLNVWTPTNRVKGPEYKWDNGYAHTRKDAVGYETVTILDGDDASDGNLESEHYMSPSENALLSAEKKLLALKNKDAPSSSTAASSSKKQKTPAPSPASKKRRRVDDDAADDAMSDTEPPTSHRSRSHKKARRSTDAEAGGALNGKQIVRAVKAHNMDYSMEELLKIQFYAQAGIFSRIATK